MTDHLTTVWLGRMPLVLASGSRTRADLLASAGLAAERIRPDIDERKVEAATDGLSPPQLAVHLARAKAEDVARRYPDRVVVGADQVLELDGSVFHKPADLAEARTHLARLQGHTHSLHSGVAIVQGDTTQTFHDTARLTMRILAAEAIDAYVGLVGEARVISSVGGYQLEGPGIHLFDRVDGDHSTVLGLPLLQLLSRFRAMDLLAIA